MHYVCIENNVVVSILSYKPNVPYGVLVYEITDDQLKQIENQTHYFDVDSKSVVKLADEVLIEKQTAATNMAHLEFLNSTDWKILRHLREKTLGLATSLTEEQFLDLERKREAAASSIK